MPAKLDPKPAGQLLVFGGRDVKRRLFAERQSVRNFLAICRQGLCVSRTVRPRMINHRMLLKINQRDKKGKTQRDRNESANDNSLQLVAREGSMHLKARTPSRQRRANRFLAIKSILSIAWNSFTASDPPPRSPRPFVAPSDLQPRPRPGVDAQSNARAPMRSSRQSIASSHSSKRSSALGQPFSSLPELVGALE